MERLRFLVTSLTLCCLLFAGEVFAAPGDVLFSDNFESGSLAGNWSISGSGSAGVTSNAAISGSRSMFTRWRAVTVTSNGFNASVAAANFSVWIRRGTDTLLPDSEDTDNGEDLVLEYRNNSGTWITLETFLGSGSNGEILTQVYSLPSDALHNNLALRFRQTNGNGPNYDYWHIDDVLITEVAPPVPGTGFCDDFESGLSRWTVSNSTRAGIGTQTSSSPTHSLYLRHDAVTATSDLVDMTGASGTVSAWIRRGSDSFSEDPDNGENLVVEYFNNASNWVALETFPGNGSSGQIFFRNYNLPADALHMGFRLRFRLTNGNGSDFDYWHVDDVCITPAPPPAGCGLIPSTYPVYSAGEDLDIDNNVTIDIGAGPADVEQGDNNGNAIDITLPANNNVADRVQTLPSIEPASFPATGSMDIDIASGTTQTIDIADIPPGDGTYDEIRVRDNATVNFTGGGPFYIDRLRADDTATINFDAGTYFIDRLDVTNDDVTINVNGEVRLFIGDRFTTGNGDDNLTVNQGGNVSDLVVFLYPGAEFDMDGRFLDFTGVIYGPNSGDIKIDDDSTITGAIIGGADISINDDVALLYDSTVAAAVASITTCLPSMFDHYAISHAGTGITCAPTAISFTGHTSSDALIAPPTGTTITVSINNNIANLGTWSLNTGNPAAFTALANGMATYTFDGTETSVILDLLYPQIGTINLNLTDGAIAESEDPDLEISRAALLWSPINTQISGKPSNVGFGAQAITLQAVRASDSNPAICVPGFPNGSVRSVDIGAECNNPSTCAGRLVSITNNAIATAVSTTNDNAGAAGASAYTPVNLLFGANATANIVLNYPDAGQMSLHAKYNLTIADPADLMNGTSGSSNLFVVRPFAYRLSVAANPGETSVTEGTNIFRDAGENFDTRLEAVVWEQADDTDNDGLPDNYTYTTPSAFSDLLALNAITPNFGNESATAALSHTVVAPVGGVNGSLSPASAIFVNGMSTTATSWDEVGAMSISALTTDYLASGQSIAGISANIGRFHPAQYAITNATVTPALNSATCGLAQTVEYTYSRQPFVTQLTLQAQSTTGTRTANYQGAFATLSAADLDNTDALPLRNGAAGPVYDLQDGTFVTDFSAGTTGEAIIDVALTWNMPVQLPTPSIVTATSPSTDDTDAGGTDIAIVGDGVDINNIGSTEVRYGRLKLFNAFGSELVQLAVPLQVDAYQNDGTTDYFGISSDDYCSTYDGSLINVVSTTGLTPTNLAFSGANTVTAGLPVTIDPIVASQIAPGEIGSANIELPVPAWLKFDWDNDPLTADQDPPALITFGIYNGSESTIYIREVY